MIMTRNRRRAEERARSNANQALAVYLSDFYEYLSKRDKPTNEEVREMFTHCNNKWHKYCRKHKYTGEIKDLFVKNVDETWKRKKEQSEKQALEN